MKKSILLIIAFGGSLLMANDLATFTAVAIDETSGLPVEGVRMHANFEKDIGVRIWTESPVPDTDNQITGRDGFANLKGRRTAARSVALSAIRRRTIILRLPGDTTIKTKTCSGTGNLTILSRRLNCNAWSAQFRFS